MAGAVLALTSVIHQIAKPTKAWQGTSAERLLDLSSLTEQQVFLTGSAWDAARGYPERQCNCRNLVGWNWS